MVQQRESTTSSTADGSHKKRKQPQCCENKKRNNQHVSAPEDSIVSDIQDVETFVADEPAFAHSGSTRNDVEHHQGDKLRKMEDACRTILQCIGKCSYMQK